MGGGAPLTSDGELVAGVGVRLRRREIAVKNDGPVTRADELKTFARRADQSHLGTIQRITHLIHFDGSGWRLGAKRLKQRQEEESGKRAQERQLPY